MRTEDKRIVMDLDHTLCFPNLDRKDTDSRYRKATPNEPVIKKLRLLKELGYHITIHTARRMKTFNGDVVLIMKDCDFITRDWLKEHSVPFDNLVYGKPYSSSYYVDDKAMTVESFLDDSFKP